MEFGFVLCVMSSFPKMQRVNRVSATTPVWYDNSIEHRIIGPASITTAFRRILSRKYTAHTLQSIRSTVLFNATKPSMSLLSLDPIIEPEPTGVSSGAHPMAVRTMRFREWSCSSGRPLSRMGHDSNGHRVHVGRRRPYRLHSRHPGPQPLLSLRRVSLDAPRPPVELALQQQQLLSGRDGVLFGFGSDLVCLLDCDHAAVANRTIVVARCESSRSSSFCSGRGR